MTDRSHSRTGKTPFTLLVASCGVALLAAVVAGGWLHFRSSDHDESSRERVTVAVERTSSENIEARTEAFCGDCHRFPRADYFARARWHSEVERGYRFFDTSLRTDLSPPPMAEVVAYYRRNAPETLVLSRPKDDAPDPLRFRRLRVARDQSSAAASPAISFLKSIVTEPGEPPRLFACDMHSGELLTIDTHTGTPVARPLAQVGHPAHVEPCDLDGDGALDLVVADLGSFLPEDHDRGRVVWLRNIGLTEGNARAAESEQIVVLDGVGRVADVRPFDPDGDGDQDLVIAEFGWQTTGSIQVLVNDGATPGPGLPKFSAHEIDRRHGAIHVPVLDGNGDGRDDFCGLISQEHETIEFFSSLGDGTFRVETVSPPEDPAFGSSGMELVDLDADGDTDVLYSNGDTFDSYELKPYHGIQWIENRGGAWATHRLTTMPGVQKAVAGDLDGDGDIDVAAVAFLPERVLKDERHPASEFDSVIWLEQTSPGKFARHALERGKCQHVALELVDFDGDGRLDIAVGNFQAAGDPSPATLWLNLPVSESPNGIVTGAKR